MAKQRVELHEYYRPLQCELEMAYGGLVRNDVDIAAHVPQLIRRGGKKTWFSQSQIICNGPVLAEEDLTRKGS